MAQNSKNETQDEPNFIVCMRADAELTTAGSRFDRKCSRCSHAVMTSPSSEALFSEEPDLVIVCHLCLTPEMMADAEPTLAAPVHQVLLEMTRRVPNPYRQRN